MELADARSILPQTQQALRQRTVAAVVEQGRAQQARELGVAPPTVNRWVQRDRARGEPALAARKQGRPPHPNWKQSLRSSGSSVGSCCPDRWWATTCAAWCALCHAKSFSSWTFIRCIEPTKCSSGWPSTQTKSSCSTCRPTVQNSTRTST